MKRRDEQFNQDIDAMLHEQHVPEAPDAEYQDMLQIARELQHADFSQDSDIRDSLRQKLLNRKPKDEKRMLNLQTKHPAFLERLPSFTTLAAVLALLLVGGFLLAVLSSPGGPEPVTTDNNVASDADNQLNPQQQASPTIVPTVPPISGFSGMPGQLDANLADADCELILYSAPRLANIVEPDVNLSIFAEPDVASDVVAVATSALPMYAFGTVACQNDADTVFIAVMLSSTGRMGWVQDSPALRLVSLRVVNNMPGPTTVPSATATPIATICDNTVVTQMFIGRRGVVTDNFPELQLRLRSAPSLFESEVIDTFSAGTTFFVVDGPECEDSMAFWQVEIEGTGETGWFTETFEGEYVIAPVSMLSQTDATATAFIGNVTQEAVNPLSCADTLPTRLEVGDAGAVIDDAFPGLELRLRTAPSFVESEVIGTYPDGTTFTVFSDPICADGVYFYRVRIDADNEIGFFTETFEGEYVIAPVEGG